MRPHYVAIILSALVFGCNSANAEMTVNELLKDYDSANAERRRFIEMLVSENANGISWTNVFLEEVRKEKPLYCQPDALVLTGPQILDMLRRDAKEFPETGGHPFGYGILAVSMRVFPCSKPKISD
jgi:hypothetical protein